MIWAFLVLAVIAVFLVALVVVRLTQLVQLGIRAARHRERYTK